MALTPEHQADIIARHRIRALAFPGVSYLPGSTDKRVARQLNEHLDYRCNVRAMPLTPHMVAMAAYMAWKYRRQLPAHLVPETPQDRP